MARCLIAAALMYGLWSLMPAEAVQQPASLAAKCVGADPCLACSNCRRCGYCKGGKTCGACKPKKLLAVNICR